jgi:hypothetical protein
VFDAAAGERGVAAARPWTFRVESDSSDESLAFLDCVKTPSFSNAAAQYITMERTALMMI